LFTFFVLLPFILLWIINYLRPALYDHERRYLSLVPTVYFLSIVGMVVGWYVSVVVLIPQLQSFSGIAGIQNLWSINNIVSFILCNLWVCAVMFQIPLVISSLHSLKLINLKKLANARKTVIVVAIIIGAVVTPTVDAISQFVVAGIIYFLFEGSIQYCLVKEKLSKRKHARASRS